MNYNNATLTISAGFVNQLPEPMPEIVFAGRSNVGKSTLINKLLNRKSLARVSSSPGKTATINFYNIDNSCYFVDLPGYGYARKSRQEKEKWGRLIEGYFASGRDIRLVLVLVDIRHKPTGDDLMLMEWLASSGRVFLVVATKSDKLSGKEAGQRLAELREEAKLPPHIRLMGFSAMHQTSREELIGIIERALGDGQ